MLWFCFVVNKTSVLQYQTSGPTVLNVLNVSLLQHTDSKYCIFSITCHQGPQKSFNDPLFELDVLKQENIKKILGCRTLDKIYFLLTWKIICFLENMNVLYLTSVHFGKQWWHAWSVFDPSRDKQSSRAVGSFLRTLRAVEGSVSWSRTCELCGELAPHLPPSIAHGHCIINLCSDKGFEVKCCCI